MFNPHDWYWLADDGRLFSSFRCTTIKATDKDFKKWEEAGNRVTRWPTDDEGKQTDEALDVVLYPYGIRSELSGFKAQLIERINNEAENRRSKYITPGDGQMMTYIEKITQARACLAATTPGKAEYPMMAAEIGITAESLVGVAKAVVAAYDLWIVAGAAIEATRRAANLAVQSAETRDAVQAAFNSVAWPD